MSVRGSTHRDANASGGPTARRLLLLDLAPAAYCRPNRDGSDLKTIVNERRKLLDGPPGPRD